MRRDRRGSAPVPGTQADDDDRTPHQIQIKAHRGQQRAASRDDDANTQTH